MTPRSRSVFLILRIGLAFALLYPAINAVFNPLAWIGYFPPFMRGIIPDTLLLNAFGALEALLALWILSGWRIFYPSAAAFVLLVAIVITNPPQFQVVFRDLSIAAIALALAVANVPTFKKQ